LLIPLGAWPTLIGAALVIEAVTAKRLAAPKILSALSIFTPPQF